MKIIPNVGGWDRTIRLILGVVLFILGFTGVFQGALEVIGYIVGAIALITGLTTYCPANALLGFNSRKAAASASETETGGESKPSETTE